MHQPTHLQTHQRCSIFQFLSLYIYIYIYIYHCCWLSIIHLTCCYLPTSTYIIDLYNRNNINHTTNCKGSNSINNTITITITTTICEGRYCCGISISNNNN